MRSMLVAVVAALAIAGARMSPASEASVIAACTADALRLCHEYIPNRAKVTRCMIFKQARVSSWCKREVAATYKHHLHGKRARVGRERKHRS